MNNGRVSVKDSMTEDGDVPGSFEVVPCLEGGGGLRGGDSWEAQALATARRNARGSGAASSAARLDWQWPSCSPRWWPRKVPAPRVVLSLVSRGAVLLCD